MRERRTNPESQFIASGRSFASGFDFTPRRYSEVKLVETLVWTTTRQLRFYPDIGVY